jgi:sugar transferase EpsL
MAKFRTMRGAATDEAELFSDEQRVTRLGRILRATSLDELPELWLVLTGRMSLVCPRPLLPIYLQLYRGEQRRRHEVRPGRTGLAQVNGRQDLTLKQRLDLDVEYVLRRSLGLDLAILFRTVMLVLRRDGVRTGQAFADIDDIGLAEALRAGEEAGSA